VFPIRDLNPTRITPLVTIVLVLANILVWLFWQPKLEPAQELEFLYRRAAVACEVSTGEPLTVEEFQSETCVDGSSGNVIFPEKSPYQSIVVSLFLHGGIVHLLGNMWFLWLFGNNVEEAYGHVRYLLVYLLAGVAATLGFILLHLESTTPLVGASGAIAGVLGAYLVLYPTHLVLSWAFITVVPVPALLFLGLWFVGQFAVGDVGVAWEAHVAGFLFGAIVTFLFRGPLRARVDALDARTSHALW
jgi:membrane associated rhomboid family serine protease